ncbi:hypothetical protein BESB_066530 [Besnoitia besnoiti]|uniref:Transmembrane protein n=1 Tax=Besnoitia besnoiti TaxID=94643 RepID=A0A2A9MGR9_BESBE|nr:hypothetical protein BESB_066530 [Besnoitia besnoiti]PFH34620.1 hypothetical protein BESB_066530 [Besnoitia besnoiti]
MAGLFSVCLLQILSSLALAADAGGDPGHIPADSGFAAPFLPNEQLYGNGAFQRAGRQGNPYYASGDPVADYSYQQPLHAAPFSYEHQQSTINYSQAPGLYQPPHYDSPLGGVPYGVPHQPPYPSHAAPGGTMDGQPPHDGKFPSDAYPQQGVEAGHAQVGAGAGRYYAASDYQSAAGTPRAEIVLREQPYSIDDSSRRPVQQVRLKGIKTLMTSLVAAALGFPMSAGVLGFVAGYRFLSSLEERNRREEELEMKQKRRLMKRRIRAMQQTEAPEQGRYVGEGPGRSMP